MKGDLFVSGIVFEQGFKKKAVLFSVEEECDNDETRIAKEQAEIERIERKIKRMIKKNKLNSLSL